MIRTLITPQQQNISIVVPQSYVGKQIEVLLYAIDELTEEKTKPKKTMADFWGSISDETAAELHKNVEESRNSWEDRLKKQF